MKAEFNLKKNYKIDVRNKFKSLVSSMEGFSRTVSPDGRYLAFVSKKNNPTGSLWVQDLKTQIRLPVTQGEGIDIAPSW